MPAPPPEPYALVTLTHQLSKEEVAMLRALCNDEREGRIRTVAAVASSPNHEVVHAYRRLVVLGLIEEYPGRVAPRMTLYRITPAAERLLRTLSIENGHHFSPENPQETQR